MRQVSDFITFCTETHPTILVIGGSNKEVNNLGAVEVITLDKSQQRKEKCSVPDLPSEITNEKSDLQSFGKHYPPPLAMKDSRGRPVVCRNYDRAPNRPCYFYDSTSRRWRKTAATTITDTYGSSVVKLRDGRYWKVGGWD